jgi:hypothetical protein
MFRDPPRAHGSKFLHRLSPGGRQQEHDESDNENAKADEQHTPAIHSRIFNRVNERRKAEFAASQNDDCQVVKGCSR